MIRPVQREREREREKERERERERERGRERGRESYICVDTGDCPIVTASVLPILLQTHYGGDPLSPGNSVPANSSSESKTTWR